MISLAIELLKRYLPQIIGAIVIISAYFWWHHSVVMDTEDRINADIARQSDELLKRKLNDAYQLNKLNQERANNAIQIYAKHYDDLRAAANTIPQRVYIRTKTSCSGNTMPGTGKNRSETTPGSERISKAELPESNIRELNKVIMRIEEMQLKCEQLLNTVN